MKIFTPIVEHLHLQIRFNVKTRNVEIKVFDTSRVIESGSSSVKNVYCKMCSVYKVYVLSEQICS